MAIVLPLTLKGSSDDGVNPIDTPEYNVYAVDATSLKATVFNQTFVIKNKDAPPAAPKAKSFMATGESVENYKNTDYRPVNPKDIPVN